MRGQELAVRHPAAVEGDTLLAGAMNNTFAFYEQVTEATSSVATEASM
jgi:hypothetical protein